MHQAVPYCELPQCMVCKLDPLPQSSQHMVFILAQVLLFFISFYLSIILLVTGYSFSAIRWLCPQCKRVVDVPNEPQGTNDNIIIRVGNCMVLLSKFKFRVIAVVLVMLVLYLIGTSSSAPSSLHISSQEKTWESMADHCGYEVYVENTVKADLAYKAYVESGHDWVIDAIYLNERQLEEPKRKRVILMKMDPSQFENRDREDIVVWVDGDELSRVGTLQQGDILRLRGGWHRRVQHEFVFVPLEIERTGIHMKLENVRVLQVMKKFLTTHNEERHK